MPAVPLRIASSASLRPLAPPPSTVTDVHRGRERGCAAASLDESLSRPWWPCSPVIAKRNWPFPWYPSSVSKASSPAKRLERCLTFTVPPKNSKPSSSEKATSTWSTTVPLPTPANVMPLISLSSPTIAPPCHTRTYRSTPLESVGSEPPYSRPDRPSTSLVPPRALIGARPRRTSPPHLPRTPCSTAPLAASKLALSLTIWRSIGASSSCQLVKVIGAAAVPSA